jgi:hypothetical protein
MSDLTPAQRAELDELRAALEAEFRDDDQPAHAQSARTDLSELKSSALDAMKHTLDHGTNETNKVNLAKWVYEKLLDEGKAETDPLRLLIEGMPAPTPKEDSEAPS